MARPLDLPVDSHGKRRTRGLDAAIAAIADRQHGVIARRQLARLGLEEGAIEHRLNRGRLHRIHRGVYAVGHRPRTSAAAWMAAVLIADDAVLSHRSAAALWGIRRDERPAVDITVPSALRRRARLDIHQARLLPDEITTHHGIPVTTPARTLLDLAACVPYHHLEKAANEAEIQRLASPTSLADLLVRYPNRRGTAAVRALLGRRAIGRHVTKRELELRFLAFLDAHALPRPATNATVAIPERPNVDCLWPAHRLVAELDGYATHGTRKAFERDHARDRALLVAGYRVTRITWRQLGEDEPALAHALRRLLEPPPGG